MSVRVGVIIFPGTLDDGDACRAVTIAGAQPIALWHLDTSLHDVDAVIIPGGFSYGDYLRAGAIASRAPIMQTLIPAALAGLPVLGICNGFQILCEAGLLPGALVHNHGLHFRCIDQWLTVDNVATPWTSHCDVHEEIIIPLKSSQGCYVAPPETLAQLEDENRIVFRYLGDNPNGSAHNIAGICSAAGNIVGIMPHPEHAVEALTGPSLDGRKIFHSVVASICGEVA